MSIGSTQDPEDSNQPGLTLQRLIAAERNAKVALQKAQHNDEMLATVMARLRGIEERLLALESKFSGIDQRVQTLTVRLMGSGPTS